MVRHWGDAMCTVEKHDNSTIVANKYWHFLIKKIVNSMKGVSLLSMSILSLVGYVHGSHNIEVL